MAEGKSHRKGIGVMAMAEMFATEEKVRAWFEKWLWGDGRACVRCG